MVNNMKMVNKTKLVINIDNDTLHNVIEYCSEHDAVPDIYRTIYNGIPYDKTTHEHGIVEGYKMALQDLNIIGKE